MRNTSVQIPFKNMARDKMDFDGSETRPDLRPALPDCLLKRLPIARKAARKGFMSDVKSHEQLSRDGRQSWGSRSHMERWRSATKAFALRRLFRRT